MDINNTISEVVVEEIDGNSVPKSELVQFREVEPIKIISIIDLNPIEGNVISIPELVATASTYSDRIIHQETLAQEIITREQEIDVSDDHLIHEEPLLQNFAAPEKETAASNDSPINEGELIQKFVQGEAEIPDIYIKLDSSEEEEDIEIEEKILKTPKKAKSYRKQNQAIVPSPSKIKTKRDTHLNSALQGLMGEANLAFARGEVEMAEKICLEIIRQNPLAPEPFFTLAEMYQSHDQEKFLNILTIAVHLKPSDRYQWIRIAELCIDRGNLQRARLCYTRAIKNNPTDYDMRLRKARLFEMMGDQSSAMYTYLQMIPHVPAERTELCLITAKNVARHFHALGKLNIALKAMQSAYNVCGHVFSLEDLNLYMELLILTKKYNEALNCLKERTQIQIHYVDVVADCNDDTGSTHSIGRCVIPDDYAPDIRAKLCVTLISLRAYHLIDYLIQNIHEHIPLVHDRLDLYIDVAEALMQEHKYAEAITLLQPITEGDTCECPPFILLRYAECLRHLNRIGEAIEIYKRVVNLAPFCYEAKFTLSALLKQQGCHVEAAKALEQQSDDSDDQPLHGRLLYERCIMLQELGEIDECLEVGCVLLSRHSIKMRTREEMIVVSQSGSIANLEVLKSIPQKRNVYGDEDEKLKESTSKSSSSTKTLASGASSSDDLTMKEEYELFKELLSVAFRERKFPIAERLCFGVVIAKRFLFYQKDIDRIMFLTCYFNDDCSIAYPYLREMIHKNATNIQLWNLMSLLVQKGQDLRYHRFILRLFNRKPGIKQVRIFFGHYHLHCATYKYAMNIYGPIFKETPEPILALCMAVVFNQIALQKNVLRKCAAISQAITFAHKYANLRCIDVISNRDHNNDDVDDDDDDDDDNDDDDNDYISKSAAGHEIYYNIGRIYHQVRMFHLAIGYYEKALSCCHPLVEKYSKYLSLDQEIAYNLHLIYKESGNRQKARQYLYEYCIV